MNGTHKHKCDGCNHIWEHANSMKGNKEAHTCQNCGKEQWHHHHDATHSAEAEALGNLIRAFNSILRLDRG